VKEKKKKKKEHRKQSNVVFVQTHNSAMQVYAYYSKALKVHFDFI